MTGHSIEEVIQSSDRFKLFVLFCEKSEVADRISWLKSQNVNVVNIGKVLATFIDELEDYRYLTIDAYDFLKKSLEKNLSKISVSGNEIVAVHNLGILFEPQLELNPSQLLKEFSKTSSLIIIWENQFEMPDRLFWTNEQTNVSLDFSDVPLKKLQYAL